MAESTGSGTPPSIPPEDMHWGFSYIREDIQDMRQDLKDMQKQINARLNLVIGTMVSLAVGITALIKV